MYDVKMTLQLKALPEWAYLILQGETITINHMLSCGMRKAHPRCLVFGQGTRPIRPTSKVTRECLSLKLLPHTKNESCVMSNDRRQNTNKLSVKRLFLHCFRSRSTHEDFPSTSFSNKDDPSDENLPSTSSGTSQRKIKSILSKPRTYTFKEALFYEGLLVPRGPTNPEGNTVLRIGYGLSDREISPRGIIHTSYCRSRWDSVLDLPRYRQMVENCYPDDPLVDGLPAALWIECLEPSLGALVALNRMKKKRSNLSLGRHVHLVESSSDTTIANGDNEEMNDDDVIVGPHGPPPVDNQVPPVILPTDEVRPSIWIFHDLPMEEIPESLMPFVQFSRKESFRRRSRITVRTIHQPDSGMPGIAAFPNLTVDDMPDDDESETSYDVNNSEDDTSESNASTEDPDADDALEMEDGSFFGLLFE
ncbi:hypothetical protein FSP39_024468 [Pinctada imbricata]|uniref:Uncharacterized protein n=1 Tax=Pinctada imbricata TaxID=66713 RepID=A0AA88Y6V7_PINIB|nr:hypothetical protein FSP39_024468 [Pinctada imbricata]